MDLKNLCTGGAALVLAVGVCSVSAQDLDTELVVDTFDSGSRGTVLGTGPTSCNAQLDGSEGLAISNTDGVSGTIVYHNSFAGCTGGETESPVYNVTVANDNPDRPTLTGEIEAIIANPFDSFSPNNAVLVGDDGGFNGLILGDDDDTDYYIQADVFCYDRTGAPGTEYEVHSVFLRGARNNDPNDNGGALSMDRGGSYALSWDAQQGIVSARRWEINDTFTAITNRDPSTFTEFAQQSLTGEQWHTFRIDARGDQITFTVDGSQLAQVTDSTYTNGRCGVVYRETNVADADETQGYFDRLIAGPVAPGLDTFSFESEIDVSSVSGGPVGIDVDDSGGLYFVNFAEATSTANYIPDPLGAPGTIVTIETVPFVATRGLQDIEVDSSGNVYVCGDDGAGAATVLRKYGPAPTFTVDATFNGNTAASTRRHSGLAILTGNSASGDIIVGNFTTTGDLHFYLASDGTDVGGAVTAGASTFQRDPEFNPGNSDIYQSHNGAGTDLVAVISGGDANDPSIYAEVNSGLVSSAGTPPNTAGLGIGFFSPTNTLIARDSGTSPPLVELHEVTGSAASASVSLLQSIDTSGTPGGAIANPGDQVISDATTPRRLFISDFGSGRILVYVEVSGPTAVESYQLYR